MRQNPLMIYNHITSTSKPILHQLQNGLAAKLYYRMSMMKTPLARISLLLFSSLPVRALDFSGSRSFIEALSASSGYKERAISFYSLAVPAGGRAETLGSAYTGISDDVSLLDANPAASSVLVQNEIGVFHNTWIAGTAMETLAAAGRKSDLASAERFAFFTYRLTNTVCRENGSHAACTPKRRRFSMYRTISARAIILKESRSAQT